MIKYLIIFLAFMMSNPAYSLDHVIAHADPEESTQPDKITIDGFQIPEGYQLGDFSYANSFASGRCFSFTIVPQAESSNKIAYENISSYLNKKVILSLPVSKNKTLSYSGVIDHVAYQAEGSQYSIEACDEMKLLKLASRNKLFVNKSTIDAIKETLDEHGINYKFILQNHYPQIEFTTRYGETDLNFVDRLMEEAGIFYAIERDNGKDTYVFVDGIANLSNYRKDIGYKNLYPPNGEDGEDFPLGFTDERKTQLGGYQLSDYDLLNDKFITVSAKNESGGNIMDEFQLTDYSPNMLKIVADAKLAAENGNKNIVKLNTPNPDVDLGDKVSIEDQQYYVTASNLTYSCDNDMNCRIENEISLFPSNLRFANKMDTSWPYDHSTLIGYISDPAQDANGRLGLRFPWMENQDNSVMYRALLSGTAQRTSFKKGDNVIVNFIGGFHDRPLILDKLCNKSCN